jgi:hypothetical protein
MIYIWQQNLAPVGGYLPRTFHNHGAASDRFLMVRPLLVRPGQYAEVTVTVSDGERKSSTTFRLTVAANYIYAVVVERWLTGTAPCLQGPLPCRSLPYSWDAIFTSRPVIPWRAPARKSLISPTALSVRSYPVRPKNRSPLG